MLTNLFGRFTDSLFQGLGASPALVRYNGTAIITPTPLVSHEGVQAIGEASRLIQSEAASTYTVSIPYDVLSENLARFGMSADQAIAPNSPWEISRDRGLTWKAYRTSGDPENEAFRVKLTLVSV